MSTPQSNFWSTTFRVIFLKDENLEKILSKRIKGRSFILLFSALILSVVAITVALIFLTPIRNLVPGYGNLENNRAYIRLAQRVVDLDQKSKAQELMIERFQNLLKGKHTGIADISDTILSSPKNQGEIVQRIPEDEALRNNFRSSSNTRVEILEDVESLNLDERKLFPPVDGILSAGFNKENGHYGIDILAPKDAAISAIDHGIVIAADWTLETGYTISLQHEGGLISIYKHNSSLLKTIGESVEAGEAIAIIGNTGHQTSGPHLHFELWYNGSSLNPEAYISLEE